MKNRQNYEGYSFALLEIAREQRKVNVFKKQCESLLEILKSNPEYVKLLTSYEIPLSTKSALLEKAFKKDLDEMIYRLIYVLINKHRANELIDILRLFINNVNADSKMHEGIIYSAAPLSNMEIMNICKATEKRLNCKLKLVNKIDVQLIAGIKIVVDAIVINSSISSTLDEMKHSILRGKDN